MQKIVRVAVFTAVRSVFDYIYQGEELLAPGMRLQVPFRNKEKIAMLLEVLSDTAIDKNKLKSVVKIVDAEPIVSASFIDICTWAANYYHHPIGEVIAAALPPALRKNQKIPEKIKLQQEDKAGEKKLALNSEQEHAVQKVNAENTYSVFLLDGVTGSGKTEVYLQIIENFLQRNKQVLILVPEIGLTPQTLARFRARFSVPIAIIHSNLTAKQRLNTWVSAKTGIAKIIIGTRSAVFSEFTNLGLIIVDEEHDLSFKQQEKFRYHARDVAIMRAKKVNVPIILGSATPSLESYKKVQLQDYKYLNLPKRAGVAVEPTFIVIDIRKKKLEAGLSAEMLAKMRSELQKGNQVLLFLNRRGFAPVYLCHMCGWIAKCKRCDARLTVHNKPKKLHCHHCDKTYTFINTCEACRTSELQVLGIGTEKIESLLEEIFPQYSIARIDKDSTARKGSLETLLTEIHEETHQILLGTQMLAKGHHFPKVSLVGIVDADNGFFSSDFRAVERVGQLILQVAGRAGRSSVLGQVLIQTHQPENPLLKKLITEGYFAFAQTLLTERAESNFPPYSFLTIFRAEANRLDKANDFLFDIKNLISKRVSSWGPIPATMVRRAGMFRSQLILKSTNRKLLQQELNDLLPKIQKLKTKNRVRWSVDVDPMEIF